MKRKKILLLTSSLLTDRMILYSGFIDKISEQAELTIWATSKNEETNQNVWASIKASVEKFPEINEYKEFPYNYLRKLNDLVWNFTFNSSSRNTIQQNIDKTYKSKIRRILKIPAKVIYLLGVQDFSEKIIAGIIKNYNRSHEGESRLNALIPDIIITTNPFWFHEPAITALAKKMKIPVFAFIPSWDNISTKNRLIYSYNGYIVWSEEQKSQLLKYYSDATGKPIYLSGAPQYDVFFDKKYYQSKHDFCNEIGLEVELPIITYALGSPNMVHNEYKSALSFIEFAKEGNMGKLQVILRQHPAKNNALLDSIKSNEFVKVVIQKAIPPNIKNDNATMDEQKIFEWVNTFRHSDVIVQLYSTVAIDAAFFDKPVININFDPGEKKLQEHLIKQCKTWIHMKPVFDSNAMYNVDTQDELNQTVLHCLKNPEEKKEEREYIKNFVTQYPDGRCGERLAEAILKFADSI